MYLRDLVVSLGRRWYLAALGCVLSGLLVALTLTLVPPRFVVSSSVLLLPPKSSVESGSNPFLLLGNLSQTEGVLVRSLSAEDLHKQVATAVPDATFEAAADWTTSGPILVVTTEADTAADALSAQEHALALVPEALATLQTNLSISSESQITSMVITQGADPARVTKTVMRAAIAAGAVGLAASAVAIGALDAALLRRTEPGRRKAKRPRDRGTSTDGEQAPAGVPLIRGIKVTTGPHVTAESHDANTSPAVARDAGDFARSLGALPRAVAAGTAAHTVVTAARPPLAPTRGDVAEH